MLLDALVEVVEHGRGLRDQPRRLGLIRGGLEFDQAQLAHPQRVLDRGKRIEVDAAVDDPQSIDVYSFERIGHRRRPRGASGTHVDDRVTVLGEYGHERSRSNPRSIKLLCSLTAAGQMTRRNHSAASSNRSCSSAATPSSALRTPSESVLAGRRDRIAGAGGSHDSEEEDRSQPDPRRSTNAFGEATDAGHVDDERRTAVRRSP